VDPRNQRLEENVMKFRSLQNTIEIDNSRPSISASTDLTFEKPVTVLVGIGFPRSINSVADAYAFLDDWPYTSRTAAHRIALNACRAALAGEIEVETARATFEGFARKANIHAPQFQDLIGPIGSVTARGSGSAPH
jgi:hypothetical protein